MIALFIVLCLCGCFAAGAAWGYFEGKSVRKDIVAQEKGYRDFEQIPRHKYPPFVEPNGMINHGGTWEPYTSYLLHMKWPNGIPLDVQNKMIVDMKRR